MLEPCKFHFPIPSGIPARIHQLTPRPGALSRPRLGANSSACSASRTRALPASHSNLDASSLRSSSPQRSHKPPISARNRSRSSFWLAIFDSKDALPSRSATSPQLVPHPVQLSFLGRQDGLALLLRAEQSRLRSTSIVASRSANSARVAAVRRTAPSAVRRSPTAPATDPVGKVWSGNHSPRPPGPAAPRWHVGIDGGDHIRPSPRGWPRIHRQYWSPSIPGNPTSTNNNG
jgi:hypothetical protein